MSARVTRELFGTCNTCVPVRQLVVKVCETHRNDDHSNKPQLLNTTLTAANEILQCQK